MEIKGFNNVIAVKLQEYNGKIRGWIDKRANEQLIRNNREREQFTAILQERYGYTKEQAESEQSLHYSNIRLS